MGLPAVCGDFGHEGVLETGRETGATTSTEAGVFDLLDNPILAHLEDVLRLMPIATLDCGVDPGLFIFVEVSENTVLVGETAVGPESHRYSDDCLSLTLSSSCQQRLSEH